LLALEVEELRSKNRAILKKNENYESEILQANKDIRIFKEKIQQNCDDQVKMIRTNHEASLTEIKKKLFGQLADKDVELEKLKKVIFF
jgi:hypothetical protein